MARAAELFVRGLALHREGLMQDARLLYEEALSQDPRHFDSLHLLGVIAYQTGDSVQALDLMDQAIKANPKQAAAHSNRGLVLRDLRQLNEAVESYDKAIALKPDYAEALTNRGNALMDLHRYGAALDSHDQAIALRPGFAEAYSNRGNVLMKLRRYSEAADSYERAVTLRPDYTEAHSNRGNALIELLRPAEAIESYNRAIALKPDYAEAFYNRGNALLGLQRFSEAVDSYDRAIALKPDYVQAYSDRGNALMGLKQLSAAIDSYDQAIALKPDYAEAISNRGNPLMALRRYNEAIESLDRAIALRPDYPEAYYNRGNALLEDKRTVAASESYDRAIALKPDYVQAHWNKAIAKLLAGEFREGWALYEWRWKRDQADKFRPQFAQPLWLGEQSLENKTLLVHAEQGLGDTIQFCRYIPLLLKLRVKVMLAVPASLKALLNSLGDDVTLLDEGGDFPPFDFHCPMMSLPLALKTELDTVPSATPYLRPDSDTQQRWQRRLGIASHPRIGLAWSGSATHENDHNRSLTLELLQPLLDLPFSFHCLQNECREKDISVFSATPHLQSHTHELRDFSETAALINAMDLVISVDTSLAHLAGALAKPVWILLPYTPDFRWMHDRTDSPWYPTATLFRQPVAGDWSSVIGEVLARLRDLG
jgi:tetratricopeptide (TPR) repeat protein